MKKEIAELKYKIEKYIYELKSEIEQNPVDEWDRGWNAAFKISIRRAEKIVELIDIIGKENHE